MRKYLAKSFASAVSIIAVIFVFVPEESFGRYKPFPRATDETNTIVVRILTFIAIFIVVFAIKSLYRHFRKKVRIRGKNYTIIIKYDNLFEMRGFKKIVPFDECYTTNVGELPSDINPTSVCGQYLLKNPIDNMNDKAKLKPLRSKSKYHSMERYSPGSLVPNGEYLLMSFAKLDKEGLGRLSYDEFIECLSLLWKEINKHHGQKCVCMPIFGSGVTRMDNALLTQQELLDIIIGSYKISPYKIKLPQKIYIVCKRREGFSLNKICENI